MNRTDKIQVLELILASLILLGCLAYGMKIKGQVKDSYYPAPINKSYNLNMYEDGSYEITYRDGTSEIGCMKGGLCND